MGSAAAKIETTRPSRPTLTLLKTPPKPGRPKVRRPMGLMAFERLARLIDEIGEDTNYEWGWQAIAAEELGITRSVVWLVHHNKIDSIGTRVIDQILAQLRCSIAEFFEET